MVFKDKEIIDYISSRELPSGGFSDFPYEGPSLEDTYFALRSLQELGVDCISSNTAAYLEKVPNAINLYLPRLYYHYAVLVKNYGLKIDLKEVGKSLKSFHHDTISELYYSYYFRKICFGQGKISVKEQNALKSKTPGKLKYIEEVEKYVLLMEELKMAYDKKKFIRWLQSAQSYDGSFGIIPDTTGFLEHTYVALRALAALGVKLLEAEKCKRFVLSCLIGRGGFGRQSTTVSNLEYTYYGVMSLKILNSWQLDSNE